jgi:signal transduction histidine kinase
VIALLDRADGLRAGLWAIPTNLVWVALVAWGTIAQIHPGLTGRHLAAILLLAIACAGWLLWIASRISGRRSLRLPSWTMMAVAGGALATLVPLALTFVGVAGLAAGMTWPLDRALLVVAAGPLATLASARGAGASWGIVLGSVAAALGGLTLGVARRQTQESAMQSARVEVSEAHAEAERARAELLEGRNHMARELHDILAHTLSALSLQLEALNALIDAGPEPEPEVRSQLNALRRLVREGLDDARGAVRALREDLPPLQEQLAKLAGERAATLRVRGDPRQLSPDVSLVLYRVAQEALTNAAKHAPGATTEVDLAFEEAGVRVSVVNGPGGPAGPAGAGGAGGAPLAGTGGGYGLQGIQERVRLVGGQVETGPADGGWRVQAEVPA